MENRDALEECRKLLGRVCSCGCIKHRIHKARKANKAS